MPEHQIMRTTIDIDDDLPEPPYVVPSRRMGDVRDDVDLLRASQTADALEDEERVRTMHLRK